MKRIPSYVVAVSAALALAALTAGATARDDDQDRPHGLRQELNALKAQVEALQATVATLQNQLANAQNVLALDPFVSVHPDPELGVAGPHIFFAGANLHIVSGSGSTNDSGNPTGLGNLIIGYDEDPGVGMHFPPLNPGDRSGSHNLVIGRWNRFTRAAFGGLVAGENNTLNAESASILGGAFNTVSGENASVSGGFFNIASKFNASILGGIHNTASGPQSTVSGGSFNIAIGADSSILGGRANTVSGLEAVILGGLHVTDKNDNSIAPGAPLNFP